MRIWAIFGQGPKRSIKSITVPKLAGVYAFSSRHPSLEDELVKLGNAYADVAACKLPAQTTLDWPVAVLSLQTLLDYEIVVGARTALELQGYGHYLPATRQEVHLYGDEKPPTWLDDLNVGVAFRYHPSRKLFGHAKGFHVARPSDDAEQSSMLAGWTKASILETPLGHWQWPLKQSPPERALLELLDELPDHESSGQVDALWAGSPPSAHGVFRSFWMTVPA